MKYLLYIGLMVLSLPFWLPRSLGGDTSFHFVLTPSMKGAVDPGSFVVVRRMNSYTIGDVVGYWLDPEDGKRIMILHRIVGRLPDGRYLVKGDAVTAVEEVGEQRIAGRMMAAIPWLGFIPGAFKQNPLLIGLPLLALFFIDNLTGKNSGDRRRQAGSFFIPAALVLLFSFPFAAVGLAAVLGKVYALLLLIAFLVLTRIIEVRSADPRVAPVMEVNYVLVIFLSFSTVSIPYLVQSVRGVVGL